jgi:hypothetical protein
MSKARSAERKRMKRKEKHQAARRKASISPLKRLAQAPGEAECWISQDFESLRQMQVLVYKQAAGLSAMACFLVDRGVVGLKDAFVHLSVSRTELQEKLGVIADQGIKLRRGTIAEARRWIAAAMRWASENGMCLPRDWHKPASLIGGVGDWASADLSGFVKEFAGHPEDLRQRLVGEPFDAYIQRSDIEFEFVEDAPYMDQETGDYVGPDDVEESFIDALPEGTLDEVCEIFTPAATALAAQTRQWLEKRKETPSEQLIAAWQSMMFATSIARRMQSDADDLEVAELIQELLVDASSRIKEHLLVEHEHALEQVLSHFDTDPDLMRCAVLEHGLAGNPRDPDEPSV